MRYSGNSNCPSPSSTCPNTNAPQFSSSGDIYTAAAGLGGLIGYMGSRYIYGLSSLDDQLWLTFLSAGAFYIITAILDTGLQDQLLTKVNQALCFFTVEPLIGFASFVGIYVVAALALQLLQIVIIPFFVPFMAPFPYLIYVMSNLNIENPAIAMAIIFLSFIYFAVGVQIFAYPMLSMQRLLHSIASEIPRPSVDPTCPEWGGRGSSSDYGFGYFPEDVIKMMLCMFRTIGCALKTGNTTPGYLVQMPLTAFNAFWHGFGDVILDIVYAKNTWIPKFDGLFDCPDPLLDLNF